MTNKIEEEIKEDIENINEDKEDNTKITYDKFLLESINFEEKKKRNDTQNLLKENIKNIISEIKEKKNEIQKQKNWIKKELTSNLINNDIEEYENDFEDIEEDEKDEEIVNNLIKEKMENEINLMNEEKEKINLNEKIEEKKEENEIINFDEKKEKDENDNINFNLENFLNENSTYNYEDNDIVNLDTNRINDNNFINIQNEINGNFILSKKEKNNNEKRNKSLNYIVNGDPNQQQKILDNYYKFQADNKTEKVNYQKKFNSLSKVKNYHKSNENNINNYNGINIEEKNYNIFIIDDKTEEEKEIIELKRQKKLKTLEENSNRRRTKSNKNIMKQSKKENSQDLLIKNIKTNNNNIINDKRPSSKNFKNINNNIKISSNKKTSKSNNISKINDNTIILNNISNISNRIPVKIQREESIIANKKIKNIKYNKISNKKIIIKAINKVCLAGIPNKEYREKILEIINNCSCENYIILFKGNFGSFNLKAVYTFNIENKVIELLTCINNSPNFIYENMVSTFYKYNISQNQFKELKGNKEFNVIVDGICIYD